MMFTNYRSVNSDPHKQNRSFGLNISKITYKGTNIDTHIEAVPVKKMLWGEPFWFLFHTMAEKVKDELFPTVREELLNLIYTICTNLPCPDCSNHATQYLNGINFKKITTKLELKELLFTFHNMVNKKKNVALFPREGLEKYESAKMIPILNNFMYHFRNKKSSIQMIANDFHRERIFKELQKWFSENIQIFNL